MEPRNRVIRGLIASGGVVDRAAIAICASLLVVMVLLNGFEIMMRNLGASSLYSTQLSIALGTLVYFLGYAVLMNRDQDISVRFIYDRLPVSLRSVVDVAVSLGTALFFGVVLSASLSYYRLTSSMQSQVLPVAQSTTVLPIVVGSAGCLWVSVVRAVASVRQRRG